MVSVLLLMARINGKMWEQSQGVTAATGKGEKRSLGICCCYVHGECSEQNLTALPGYSYSQDLYPAVIWMWETGPLVLKNCLFPAKRCWRRCSPWTARKIKPAIHETKPEYLLKDVLKAENSNRLARTWCKGTDSGKTLMVGRAGEGERATEMMADNYHWLSTDEAGKLEINFPGSLSVHSTKISDTTATEQKESGDRQCTLPFEHERGNQLLSKVKQISKKKNFTSFAIFARKSAK